MSAGSKRPRSRTPAGQKVFAQILGFFCCVCLPAFISALAPVSVIQLTRQNEQVVADLSTRLFYFIPYRHVVVEDVREVDDRFHAGELVRDHDRDGGREHRTESESFLVVHGRESTSEVPVSPMNIRGAVEKARSFLKQPDQTNLRITVVANWKFGVVIPLLLSPLTILYMAGISLAVWRLLYRGKRTLSAGAASIP